jgi:CBS domain-containing protein
MKSVDICNKRVVTAEASTTLIDIAKLMRKNHVGAVVVVDEKDAKRPVGIVTDRDIVVEVVAAGQDPRTLKAGEIMSSSLATTSTEDDVSWTLKVMRDHGVRRLPVIDGQNRMVGIVALDDLLNAYSSTLHDVAQAIGTERVVETALRGA